MTDERQRENAPPPFPTLDGSGSFGRIGAVGPVDAIELSPDAADDAGAGTEFVGLSVGDRRRRAFFATIALVFGLVVARAAHVQVVDHEDYISKAEGNRSRIEWVPSERGVMYDRNGEALVRNVPHFTAAVTPADLPRDPDERGAVLARLAAILEKTPLELGSTIDAFKTYPTSPVTVADELTHTQAVLVKIESARSSGVSLVMGTRREYLADARSLSHVIGYMGKVTQADMESGAAAIPTDVIGKHGLERSYEETLRGTYGRRRIEVDALGRKKTVIAEEPGNAGRNLVLTIDLGLQRDVERILADRLRAEGKSRGSAIVMRPDTGEVLAMAGLPAYDNNLFAKGISPDEFRRVAEDVDSPLFPRPYAALLPSGSTFKLIVAAAALAENVITPRTSVLSTGGIRIDQWFFPDWKYGGHGPTDVVKAIAESVNTFFYVIGGGTEENDYDGLGVERITGYARRFGLGRTLGIDLPGEAAGFLPSRQWKERVKGERWYVGDTYHLSIGQGDTLVTPLQIASMTSVFANGGELISPRVVGALAGADGTREVREPVVLDRAVVGPEAIDAVRLGMRRAVTVGSARSLSTLPVAVAGKTGTAQWHSTREPHAWFTSFAPYEDPEIVVTVVVEEGGEGSDVAAAVARDIYAAYFAPDRRLP